MRKTNTTRQVGIQVNQGRLERWWQLKRRRGELLNAISGLTRYAVYVRHTKRPIFCFLQQCKTRFSALTCFAFADDYSFGILQSARTGSGLSQNAPSSRAIFVHTRHNLRHLSLAAVSNKCTDRRRGLGGREVRRVRAEALAVIPGGLRAVYRTLELPGKHPLKDAHAALDAAVLSAYGFSPKADLLKQLLDLNHAVAAKEKTGEPVTAPGVPASYGDPNRSNHR